MTESRRHHFVPQLYQRGFARQSGQVWRAMVLVRRTGEKRGPMSVREVFFERDYNTITDADGNDDVAFERLLAEQVEDTAAYGLRMLRAGGFPLWPDHRYNVGIFMSAQLSRGRNVREGFGRGMGEAMGLALSIAAQSGSDEYLAGMIGRPLQPGEREQLIRNREHLIVRPSNETLLRVTLSNLGEIAGMLLMRTWTLAIFDRPCLFTGEHPVVHINPSGDDWGYGVATAERLYMPVSTTHALVLSQPWSGWPEAVIRGTGELAQRLNWAMLIHPSNNELLLHPDVVNHPLPVVTTQKRNMLWPYDTLWPWGPDPKSAPPPFLQISGGRRRRVSKPEPR